MRSAGLLFGLVVAGATAVGASTLTPSPEPTLVTAGAGLLGVGIVGLAVEGIDAAVERHRVATPLGRVCGRRHGSVRWLGRVLEVARTCERETGPTISDGGLSKADRLVVALGAGAVFVRVSLVHLVADPLRVGGAALTLAAVVTIGVVVGYRTADNLLDGLRHGVLACGLGGALCVSLAAYNATRVATVGAFDAVVAGSGIVLPVGFGLFGGLAGVAGWWLAEWLSEADPLA